MFGNCYGTPRAPVEAALARGRDVLFDIDWQGTQQLREKARGDLVSIFVLPPSMRELERRLRTRAQDADDVIHARMAKAADEMSHWAEYDYVVINDDIDRAFAEVRAILAAERLKRERQTGLSDFRAPPASRAVKARRSRVCRRSAKARAQRARSLRSGSPRPARSARCPAAASSASGSPPSDLRLWRSILRRWPKAACVTRSQRAGGRRRAAPGAGPARPATR